MEPQGMKRAAMGEKSPENGAQKLPGGGGAGAGGAAEAGLVALAGGGARLAYVVLHHGGIAEPHYDLMVQAPFQERLMTWRIVTAPAGWKGSPPRVESIARLADHRAIYLSYEGPVSGDRGQVKRVVAGECRVIKAGAGRVVLELVTPERVVLELPLAGDSS